jgi:uncharacterized protein
MKIILAGGTGFIGKALLEELLKRNHSIVLLTRTPDDSPRLNPLIQVQGWDGENLGVWASQVDGADAIINLAGEPIVGKKWSLERKSSILSSRVFPTRVLLQAVAKAKVRPKVFINASAIGFYGNQTVHVREDSPKGDGFLTDICQKWESTARQAEILGSRVVIMRLGIVLGKTGGALPKMLPPFRLFMGGPIGSGTQGLSWIHIEDVVRAFLFALENPLINDSVNVVAPHPVTMKEFSTTLGKTLHRPSWMPVPAAALKMIMGEMANTILEGCFALPQKLEKHGFTFTYPHLEQALASLS